MSANNRNIDSRFDTGLPENADAKIMTVSAGYYYAVYSAKNWKESDLSEYFGTDFEPFTSDDFAAILDTNKQRLRDVFV